MRCDDRLIFFFWRIIDQNLPSATRAQSAKTKLAPNLIDIFDNRKLWYSFFFVTHVTQQIFSDATYAFIVY